MVTVYSWDKQVDREVGEKVKLAAEELRKWAEGPQKSAEVASWGKHLAQMIAVFMPEQVDQVLGYEITEEGTKKPGTEFTLRQAYPGMCPAPGQSWIYISDMSLDPEVMSKVAELFQKHGVGEIWAAILRNG